jgi:hypothetical protein
MGSVDLLMCELSIEILWVIITQSGHSCISGKEATILRGRLRSRDSASFLPGKPSGGTVRLNVATVITEESRVTVVVLLNQQRTDQI